MFIPPNIKPGMNDPQLNLESAKGGGTRGITEGVPLVMTGLQFAKTIGKPSENGGLIVFNSG